MFFSSWGVWSNNKSQFGIVSKVFFWGILVLKHIFHKACPSCPGVNVRSSISILSWSLELATSERCQCCVPLKWPCDGNILPASWSVGAVLANSAIFTTFRLLAYSLQVRVTWYNYIQYFVQVCMPKSSSQQMSTACSMYTHDFTIIYTLLNHARSRRDLLQHVHTLVHLQGWWNVPLQHHPTSSSGITTHNVQQCGIFKNMFPVLVTSGNVLHLMITSIWIPLGVWCFTLQNLAELR